MLSMVLVLIATCASVDPSDSLDGGFRQWERETDICVAHVLSRSATLKAVCA